PGSRFSVPSESRSPPSDTILASPRLLPMNRWSSVTLVVGEQKRGHSENQELAASLFPACNDLRPICGANSRCAADALARGRNSMAGLEYRTHPRTLTVQDA